MVISYIKVNGKTYSLEALSERFVHIPTRRFVEIFRHNNVVLPRLLRILLLRKYLTPCIQNPVTSSYFSAELKERLEYYDFFTEYQLEEMLALLKEDIDYTLYVRDFWFDVLSLKDVLDLSDQFLNLLDKQVDESFSEYNILSFNILTSHIFGDKYGFVDGVNTEQLRQILNKSATKTTLRNIAKKYNVALPNEMSRDFFASLVIAKYKEDLQYSPENLKSLVDANIKSLEHFASTRGYNITADNEIGAYVEYIMLKANVRKVNDIVYSGYILSKKNSGDPFINKLIEKKSSESILEGNHIQLYTSQSDAYVDFEYDESLVANIGSKSNGAESNFNNARNASSRDAGVVDRNIGHQQTQDVFSSNSSILDLDDNNNNTSDFDSAFTESMSMFGERSNINQSQSDGNESSGIINLSDEINNINTVLAGKDHNNVILAEIEPNTSDNTDFEIEDLNLEKESLTELEFDLDSSGADLNDISQFGNNNEMMNSKSSDSELFLDELDEGFSNMGVNSPSFDRVEEFDFNSIESQDFNTSPNQPDTQRINNGVSKDVIIGGLKDVKFDYDAIDDSEARQVNDYETVSDLMFTTENTDAITIEDDSYDLDLDMSIDMSKEVPDSRREIDYNKAPELSVKREGLDGNVFDIDVELPANAEISGNVGEKEENITKSATLDAGFDDFLREVTEMETASVLEYDEGIGKYKFEVTKEDLQKLEKSTKSADGNTEEDELLAALSDLE